MPTEDRRTLDGFLAVLERFRPHLICDIGSMDAGHSLFFRNASPASLIVAFEANPYNYAAGVKSRRPARHRIEWEYLAISDSDGVAEFNTVVQPANGSIDDMWKKGGSSLLDRKIGDFEQQTVMVPCSRLDSYLARRGLLHSGKALWIDVEGAADLVLHGAEKALKTTLAVHVEVETQEFFGGQKFDRDITELLERSGFRPVVSGEPSAQYDILFVAERLLNLRF